MFNSKAPKKSKYCCECKGSCIRKTVAETQAAAKERFGVIPNACAGNMAGRNRCPYK